MNAFYARNYLELTAPIGLSYEGIINKNFGHLQDYNSSEQEQEKFCKESSTFCINKDICKNAFQPCRCGGSLSSPSCEYALEIGLKLKNFVTYAMDFIQDNMLLYYQ
jgi:hypothetical protein